MKESQAALEESQAALKQSYTQLEAADRMRAVAVVAVVRNACSWYVQKTVVTKLCAVAHLLV